MKYVGELNNLKHNYLKIKSSYCFSETNKTSFSFVLFTGLIDKTIASQKVRV